MQEQEHDLLQGNSQPSNNQTRWSSMEARLRLPSKR